jgi:hypothetical protein
VAVTITAGYRGEGYPRDEERPGRPAERPFRGHPDEPSGLGKPGRDATLPTGDHRVNVDFK